MKVFDMSTFTSLNAGSSVERGVDALHAVLVHHAGAGIARQRGLDGGLVERAVAEQVLRRYRIGDLGRGRLGEPLQRRVEGVGETLRDDRVGVGELLLG